MKIRNWSIYRANLDPVLGSEQGKTRPVIIISENALNDLLPVVNILPLTSRKTGRKVYPNETMLEPKKSGLPNESIVLCYQVRTIDKQRLGSLLGEVKEIRKQNEIMGALCFQLGIKML